MVKAIPLLPALTDTKRPLFLLVVGDGGTRQGKCLVRTHMQISMIPNTTDLPGDKSSSPMLTFSPLFENLEMANKSKVTRVGLYNSLLNHHH
jgi:hypothetical protein